MTELTKDERKFIVRQFLDLKYLFDSEAPTIDKRIDAWEHQIYARKITGTDPAHDAFFISLMKTEIKSLKRQSKAKKEIKEEPAQKVKAIHHVLAYIFDCNATGIILLDPGAKKDIERIGQKRTQAHTGNTFYKNYGRARRIDLNSQKAINEIAGAHWGKIVISLSENPNEVRKFLISKKLI